MDLHRIHLNELDNFLIRARVAVVLNRMFDYIVRIGLHLFDFPEKILFGDLQGQYFLLELYNSPVKYPHPDKTEFTPEEKEDN